MSAINYTKITFSNYPDTTSPLNAENLNKLDKGIYDLDQALTDTNTNVTNITNNLSDNNKTFKFGFDGTNYGYYKDGASSVTPFKNPTGTKSITSNGTYNVADYASASVNVNLSCTTLWTNSSPTSDFDAQTVSISKSSYSYIIVKYRRSNTDSTESWAISPNTAGHAIGATFKYSADPYTIARNGVITSSGIEFYRAAVYGQGYAFKNYAIPIAIYGLNCNNLG